MSEPSDNPMNPPQPHDDSGVQSVYSQQYRNESASARVIDTKARGAFATGVIVHEGPSEFVLDFVQGLARPARVEARVILSPQVMEQFVVAMRENIARYEKTFGPPKELPRPKVDRHPTMQEIYSNLKVPDDQLSGCYATTAMIAHTGAEFYLDFITRFVPTAAVSARVFMSASQAPRLLESVAASFANWTKRRQAAIAAQAAQQQQGTPPLQGPPNEPFAEPPPPGPTTPQ